MKDTFTPDASQQEVIDIEHGYHLVLAPPGCGKTQILTERIRKAHENGVRFDDMLCLTFTNRAARGMQERIRENIKDDEVGNIFVGNVHRYCSKMLFDRGVIPAETSVIDDDDAISILSLYTGEDEYVVSANYKRANDYHLIIHLSHLIFQIKKGHPKNLRTHPECLNADDIKAMGEICKHRGVAFNAEAMIDMYEHADFYKDEIQSEEYDMGTQKIAADLLYKMQLAHDYEMYKEQNHLIDFEDLLLLSYEALGEDEKARENDKQNENGIEGEKSIKRYSWIQIDEVQDLSPMQLSIIDRIYNETADSVILYLGDEHQAIFSFMGAKLSTLDYLKQRCSGNLHHLSTNHRSPKYLLDVFNRYANDVLHIDSSLLPTTTYEPATLGNELVIAQSGTIEQEYKEVAQWAGHLADCYPEETTSIVVLSNKDANLVSAELNQQQIPHFKVSGDDLFSSDVIKLLFAHMGLLNNENNFLAWAHLLKGLHVFETNTASRNFVRACMNCAMLPLDFLNYENSTYIQEFVRAYENEEIVIFDTETTGLDVFSDDILQIAAVKIRRGEVVPGSELSLYIETEKEIPAMLGDIVNPIVEERKHQVLLSHADALQKFLDYCGKDVLLGHNADYDINILKNNLEHYLPSALNDELNESLLKNKYFDSLRLVKRLEPTLRQYKLKYLLEILQLEGENSHLADADVNATRSVVVHCYEKALAMLPLQETFMKRKRVMESVAILRRNYQEYWVHGQQQIYTLGSSMVSELQYFYDHLIEAELISSLPALHYIISYLEKELVDQATEPALITQLQQHGMELHTLKEADLCSSDIIPEKIYVSTVHKAKGLEFDNVIIFDAVDGRYPSFYNDGNKDALAEDARKFYVAMTRAKKRLIVMQSTFRLDYHNQPQNRNITRFMRPLLNRFEVRSLKDELQ